MDHHFFLFYNDKNYRRLLWFKYQCKEGRKFLWNNYNLAHTIEKKEK